MNHLNMNEAFRRWPLGISSFPAWADLYGAMFREWHGSPIPFDDWLFERLRPFLAAPAIAAYETGMGDSWIFAGTLVECLADALKESTILHRRIHLQGCGTVIREWPIDEYDGIF